MHRAFDIGRFVAANRLLFRLKTRYAETPR